MCLPLAPLLGGLEGAGGAVGIIGGASNRSFAKGVANRNQELAKRNAILQHGAIQSQIAQAEQRAFEATRKTVEDSLRARGRVQAAAGEAGIRGVSVDAVLQEFSRQEGRQIAAAELNAQYSREQGERDLEGVSNALESNLINSATPPQFDFIGQSLSVFGQATETALRADEFVRRNGGEPFFLPRG